MIAPHKGELEDIPWYRRRDYRGKMSEDQKRALDQFRIQGFHPAVTYAGLPEEAQGYITRLELEIYDGKQQSLAQTTILLSALGLYFLYHWYSANDVTYLIGGVIFSICPWIYYRIRWKKNANDFMPSDNPTRRSDESMREEWDINYLSNLRESQEDADENQL